MEHGLLQAYWIVTPFAIIIGGVVGSAMRDAVRVYRQEQRWQARANHPTSKGLPRK